MPTISFKKNISLFYDLDNPETGKPLPLLIALHGYGQNKEMMMKLMKQNLNFPCIIASLQAPFPHIVTPVLPGKPIKYGFGWITSFNPDEAIALHHQAIDQIIKDCIHNIKLNISRIVLLGFSQSVALNFRYIFTHTKRIDKLIAICGGLPGDWDKRGEYSFSETDILYIGCKKDLIYPAKTIRENSEKLKSLCHKAEVKIYNFTHIIPSKCFTEIDSFLFS